MPYHYINRKVEDAFEAVISVHGDDEISGYTIHAGLEVEKLSLPRIDIVCASSSAEVMGSGDTTGNWLSTVGVSIATSIEDTSRDEHSRICGVISDILMSNDLVTNLNNSSIDEFTAIVWTPTKVDDDVTDMLRMSVFEGTLYCYPATN